MNLSGASQTGDTLGKALASVSMNHLTLIKATYLCSVIFKRVRSEHKTKPWGPTPIIHNFLWGDRRAPHIKAGLQSCSGTFYWLQCSKMTGMDEFSSGYEEAPGIVAAAVKAYTEMTSCAFKMIHDLVPLLLLLSVRFIPPITRAAASPPAPLHQ